MNVNFRTFKLSVVSAWLSAIIVLFGLTTFDASAEENSKHSDSEQDEHYEKHLSKDEAHEQGAGAIGQKLANPLSDLWSLSFNNMVPAFYDGDVNKGDAKLGATTIFQPVLPIPLKGEGNSAWRMITRPVIPIVWSTPVPTGRDKFDHVTGIGDIQLPLLLSIPSSIAGKFILGGGPVFEFPTATDDDLGADQWSAGPAVVLGYKAKHLTSVLFFNYFWKVGESGQSDATPDTSKGSLLYSFTYALADGWQVGTNPTMSYNDRASSGNKWNVPIGGFVGRTIKVGKTPLNMKLGIEYSAISQDDFGQQATLRLQITPVIAGLIKNPIFGK